MQSRSAESVTPAEEHMLAEPPEGGRPDKAPDTRTEFLSQYDS